MWRKLFGNRPAREKWDRGLVWFRLRYLQARRPSHCIRLLSRPQACGRVALYFQPDNRVSRLYLGVPASHRRLLQQMVADFGFSLKPKPAAVLLPAARRLAAVDALPWERPFVAHIVDETAWVSEVEGNGQGSYFPQPAAAEGKRRRDVWQLPEPPPAGLTLQPAWNGQPPPEALLVNGAGPRGWPLGRAHTNQPLQVAGRLNIYGRQEAVAAWLAQQITQMIRLKPANLVVIDGAGNLLPKLKRQAVVTRLLGERLAYVDMDGPTLAGGFNPLAAAPGESAAQQLQRWQQWFRGMSVQPQGVQLLALAFADGVGDVPALRQWLQQQERRGRHTAVASLGLALSRLTASRQLREWLAWPTNPYDILPARSLFFACKGTGWDRQQLLRSVLLGALPVAEVSLIVHRFPWQKGDEACLQGQAEMVIGNGPLLSGSTVVLTESHTQGVTALVQRFLAGDAVWAENLELLRRGDGLVILEDTVLFTTWNR